MNVLMWIHGRLVDVRLPMEYPGKSPACSRDPSLKFAVTLWVGCLFPSKFCLAPQPFQVSSSFVYMNPFIIELPSAFPGFFSVLLLLLHYISPYRTVHQSSVREIKVSFNLHFPFLTCSVPSVSWLPGLRYGWVLFCNSNYFRIVFLCSVLTSFLRK